MPIENARAPLIFPPLPPPLPLSPPPLSTSPPLPPMPPIQELGSAYDPLKPQIAGNGGFKRRFGTPMTSSEANQRFPIQSLHQHKEEPGVEYPKQLTTGAATKRYNRQHQYSHQYNVQSGFFGKLNNEDEHELNEEEEDKENVIPRTYTALAGKHATKTGDSRGSTSIGSEPSGWGSTDLESLDSNQAIWSVTPDELADLALQIGYTARQLQGSYSVSTQRSPAFKKYYGFPVISVDSVTSCDHSDALETIEEQTYPEPVDHRKVSALSADSPSFVPREPLSDDSTSEIMKMLNAVMPPKKVAPHMDWWPGDWKCKNCGNHVRHCTRHLNAGLS